MEVKCAYCGKKLKLEEAKTYMDVSKNAEMVYFCNSDCALSELFGVIRKTREFLIGLENAR